MKKIKVCKICKYGIEDSSMHKEIAHPLMQNKNQEVIMRAYKRGFKACLVFVVVPIVLSIIVLAQLWVNTNI